MIHSMLVITAWVAGVIMFCRAVSCWDLGDFSPSANWHGVVGALLTAFCTIWLIVEELSHE